MRHWKDLIGPAGNLGYPGAYSVPAFVNAHTHLELTFQKGHAYPEPEHFPEWVDQLMHSARKATKDTYKKSYRLGLEQSLRHGSASILDHCRRAEYLLPLSEAFPGQLVTAIEFSGFEGPRAEEYFEPVKDVLARFPGRIQALSPVAPHSVSEALYRLAIGHAKEHGQLLCGHLAETVEELQFLWDGTGPFRNFMASFNPRDMSSYTPPACSSVELLERLGGLGERTIAAHCNYLADGDIEILARTGTHVVHCPGSCRFFGHDSFRLKDLMEAGVNVCLGTDSLASNDTLSVLEAMRDLRRDHIWLTDEEIFRMGTVNGHEALLCSVEPEDYPEDLCIFSWSEGRPPAEVTVEAVLNDLLTGTAEPRAVVINGETAYPENRTENQV